MGEEPNKYDETLRKKLIHPIGSIRIAEALLNDPRITEEEKRKIYFLIQYHDAGVEGFLPHLPPVQKEHPWYNDLLILSEADGAVFFIYTMEEFIKDRRENKHETDETIIERIASNLGKIKTAHFKRLINEKMREKPFDIQLLFHQAATKLGIHFVPLPCSKL